MEQNRLHKFVLFCGKCLFAFRTQNVPSNSQTYPEKKFSEKQVLHFGRKKALEIKMISPWK